MSEHVDAFKKTLRDELASHWNPSSPTPGKTPATADGEESFTWPEIMDISAMMNTYKIEPPTLIEGTLHANERMVIGGASKSNKTWSLTDLAVSVATGSDWMGRKTKKSRVVFVNFEVPSYFMKERIRKVCDAKGISHDTPDLCANLGVWTLRGVCYDLGILTKILAEKTKDNPPDLLIIDPIYKAMSSMDENAAGQVGAMMLQLEQFADAVGAALVFSHHFSKGSQAGKDAVDRLSGSGVFARSPDSILVLTRHEEEETFIVSSILRNFPTPDDYCVRMEFPILVPVEGDATRVRKPGSIPTKYTADQILLFLPLDGLNFSDWYQAAHAATSISKGRFSDLRDELVRDGRVSLDGRIYRSNVNLN